jgi:hypothetical protein
MPQRPRRDVTRQQAWQYQHGMAIAAWSEAQ